MVFRAACMVFRDPRLESAQRPVDVIGHHWIRFRAPSPQERKRALCVVQVVPSGAVEEVSERNCDIAEPSAVSDPADRSSRSRLKKARLVPRHRLQKIKSLQFRSGPQSRKLQGHSELVPGADQLAVVATVNPVADRCAKLLRNRAVMLDREVGNTAPCIEPIGGQDRLGWTNFKTRLAVAAMLPIRALRDGAVKKASPLPSADVVEQSTEEKQRTALAMKQERVLSAPSNRSFAGKFHLEQGSRVAKGTKAKALGGRTARSLDLPGLGQCPCVWTGVEPGTEHLAQGLQSLAYQPMVVCPQRIH